MEWAIAHLPLPWLRHCLWWKIRSSNMIILNLERMSRENVKCSPFCSRSDRSIFSTNRNTVLVEIIAPELLYFRCIHRASICASFRSYYYSSSLKRSQTKNSTEGILFGTNYFFLWMNILFFVTALRTINSRCHYFDCVVLESEASILLVCYIIIQWPIDEDSIIRYRL